MHLYDGPTYALAQFTPQSPASWLQKLTYSAYTVHTSLAQVQLNLKPICDFMLHKACHNPQSSLMQNCTMQDKGSAIIHYYPTSMHCNDSQTMVETVRGWFQVYTLTHMSTL